ncbi:uncharacterized protein MYCFIDRAFT_136813 [Pseudocercospora fijiensis CIRAD86]|uniref:CDC45-like protein n=1 Tax=Pseudocercospora fijiensis (strain CIRAD86) TaxID=383855 RepID=M3B061_PSEFD|nr:uncharacterized protein MYCFIDRAFT_136813 [Pseudocercospora fijiensis CIRAD86]EME82807.1 hypothetical protein MYCFIDRAFT_136813 [Pseudocercospora fijiensis CIRAD86]
MYLPRSHISQLYTHLERTAHPTKNNAIILTSLSVDSICALRILESLFRRDCIGFQSVPVSGYAELQEKGATYARRLMRQYGGEGGVIICLGLGGAVALDEILGLDAGIDGLEVGVDGMQDHGVEVWVIDSHRPLNLENVFGGDATSSTNDPSTSRRPGVTEGRINPGYRPGKGGVIVWDDGDLEHELQAEKEAYFALQGMPEITEDDLALDDGEDDNEDDEELDEEEDPDASSRSGQKRKRGADFEDEDELSESDKDRSRAHRRRRSNSSTSIPIPSSPGGNPLSAQVDMASTPPPMPSSPPKRKEPSAKQMRKQLLKLRRKHEATLDRYYDLGTSSAEPVSSMAYSLASELGREDNDMLWLACVGICSLQILPSGSTTRIKHVRELLQDEVRRLNPIPESELRATQSAEARIPTGGRSADDHSIQLSPEPRFMMIRHWSLYDSMQHSTYLATRLHLWNDNGKKRLAKLLAKMGISLQEAGKGFTHMNSELKHTLRKRILKFAEQYNLADLVPGNNGRSMEGWGFVRAMGWAGTYSAEDIAIVVGALLEVGGETHLFPELKLEHRSSTDFNYNARMRTLPTPPHSSDDGMETLDDVPDYTSNRFSRAYDALVPSMRGFKRIEAAVPIAHKLSRAIFRVGSHIISKGMHKNLTSFRMAIVREGPDVPLFTHPGALVRLAVWVNEAIRVIEAEKGKRIKAGKDDTLVIAALDEGRGVYVVVDDGTDGEEGHARRKHGPLNRFGQAFQEVVDQTGARVRIDSFEHSVVEVKKDDFQGFLEALINKQVVN